MVSGEEAEEFAAKGHKGRKKRHRRVGMKKWIGMAAGVLVSGAVVLAARLRHAKRVATPRRPQGGRRDEHE